MKFVRCKFRALFSGLSQVHSIFEVIPVTPHLVGCIYKAIVSAGMSLFGLITRDVRFVRPEYRFNIHRFLKTFRLFIYTLKCTLVRRKSGRTTHAPLYEVRTGNHIDAISLQIPEELLFLYGF